MTLPDGIVPGRPGRFWFAVSRYLVADLDGVDAAPSGDGDEEGPVGLPLPTCEQLQL